MSAEKIIRMQARQKLSNNGFAKAIFSFAVIMIFFMLFQTTFSFVVLITDELLPEINDDTIYGYINLALLFIGFVLLWLTSPVILGYIKMFSGDNDDYEFSDVFYFFCGFHRYFKALKFSLSFIMRLILPFILFFLPVVILSVIGLSVEGLTDNTVYKIANNSLIICATLAVIVYSLQYFLSFRLFCNDQQHNISSYFRTSKLQMYTNISRVTKLLASFIPWLLLCITVLPILYVVPYMTQSLCVCAKHISELSRNGQGNEIL